MNRIARLFATLALVATVAASPAFAGIDLGLKAGLSASKFAADIAETKFNTGGAAGISLAIGLAPGLTFAPELLYLRKGAELTSTDVSFGGNTYGVVKTGLKLDYIEIPVLLRFTPVGTGPVNIFVTGGPTASFKVQEKFSISGIANYSLSSDQAEGADYGVTAGAGVRMGTMATKLTLEARYEWGLANISKIPFGGDFKNTGVIVMAGLEFPLGGF